MNALERRLLAIEARRPKQSPGKERERALSEALDCIMDTLLAALPGDETLKRVPVSGFHVSLVRIPGSKSHHEKLHELSVRIATGISTDEDNTILAALPESALGVLGMSAKEFIALVGDPKF